MDNWECTKQKLTFFIKSIDSQTHRCYYIHMISNTYVKKIKNWFLRFKYRIFPDPLPMGMADFDVWADSILDTYGFPNNDSTKFSLAVMVLHLDAKVAWRTKHYFATCLHKGASNQVCAQIMQDLKNKQAEATAATQKASVDEKVSETATPTQ